MNLWLLVLMGVLVFAPKTSTEKTGAFDVRALALLLCVIAIVAQL